MRDSYERFLAKGYISKDQLFQFGLEETILAPYEKAEAQWNALKSSIDKNEKVWIRGFGQKSSKSMLYIDLYKKLLKNEKVEIDKTNNSAPGRVISELTGYSKSKRKNHGLIRNYQVSHVFGRTKNVYAFTAPWNIVYIPKLLDPFTGHEATGDIPKEYAIIFRQMVWEQFSPLIADFNTIMNSNQFTDELESCLDGLMENYPQHRSLRDAMRAEFQPLMAEV
jgi:hypothetical protein